MSKPIGFAPPDELDELKRRVVTMATAVIERCANAEKCGLELMRLGSVLPAALGGICELAVDDDGQVLVAAASLDLPLTDPDAGPDGRAGV